VSTFLAVASALGGIVAFALAVATIVRSIGRQVSATKDNTKALVKLSDAVNNLDGRVDQHAERIARLEGGRRAGTPREH